MNSNEVKCPKCGHEFEVAGALRERITEEFERAHAEEKDKINAAHEEEIKRMRAEQVESEKTLRQQIKEDISKEALESHRVEDESRKQRIEELEQANKALQDTELDLRKRTRVLEDKQRELELEVQRKVDAALDDVRTDERKRQEGQFTLKAKEKDQLIASLKTKLQDAQQKIEQGSQQSQGEVLEEQIEGALQSLFPLDDISPVPKGIRGADTIQTINAKIGRIAGRVVWEAKNTKNWNDDWCTKLADDKREVGADIAVIVSRVIPNGIEGFGEYKGVWISNFTSYRGLAVVLRWSICALSNARIAMEGRTEKADLLYRYITGVDFRNKVGTIIETFKSMQEDLESEKRKIKNVWSKREKQLEKVIGTTAALYGDMQGYAENELPELEILSLPEEIQEKPEEEDLPL
jgi:hypothetical protein